jgi:antirestriction protein ArdC
MKASCSQNFDSSHGGRLSNILALVTISFTKRETDEASGEERDRKVPLLKSYSVFNIEQTEGLPVHLYAVAEPKPLEDALEEVDAFIERIGADVRYGGDRACYAPAYDVISLP